MTVTVTAAVLLGAPTRARAQVVGDCQPGAYLDRTAPAASRQLTWDFSIATDPARCLKVQVGQTVVWNGDFDTHPLGGSGGDTPNPIGLHVNGSVTFNAVGTFGFTCLVHSSMKGAILVVPAPAPPVPAVPSWLLAILAVLVTAWGWVLSTRSSGRWPGSSRRW